MKREDLIKALNARNTLKKYYGDGERYFGTRLRNFEYEHRNDGELVPLDEDKWFPQIDALKDKFDILKKEIKDVISEKQAAEKFMKHNFKCDHSVRITNYHYYGLNHYEDTCILCGKNFYDSYLNRRNDMHRLNEKNKKMVTFIGKEDVTPSGFWCGDYEYIVNYTEKNIVKILFEILEKNNNEDIDLVDEIEKLNLKKCIINKPHNKNLVLLIVGSNKEYIDNYSYIMHENNINDVTVVEYFKELYNIAIEIVGDEESIKKYKSEDDLVILQQYTGIKYLKGYLEYIHDIPFSLIIDMSSLYNYQVIDNKIVPTRHKIDLKAIFPNTPIINIEDMAKKDITELEEFLKKEDSNTYCYKDNSYYYLEDNKLAKTQTSSDIYDKIKRLIKKREQ